MALPETGMESTGSWTGHTPEADFIEAVRLNQPARVTVTQIGTSTVDNLVLRKVVVKSTSLDVPSILIVGGQHGDEPAGREAILALLRDYSISEKAEWKRLREMAEIVFLPTVNPVGRWYNEREARLQQDPIILRDPNIDSFTMMLTEVEALQQVITDHKPIFVIDCHEYAGDVSRPSIEMRPNVLPRVDPALKTLSRKCYDDLSTGLATKGHQTGLYNANIGTWFQSLQNVSPLRYATSFLVETARIGVEPVDRVAAYADLFDVLIPWLWEHLGDLHWASVSARRRWMEKAQSMEGPIDLLTGTVLENMPQGYKDLENWSPVLDVFGVEGEEKFVSLSQEAGPLLPYIMDPQATAPKVSASRAEGSGEGFPAPGEITHYRFLGSNGETDNAISGAVGGVGEVAVRPMCG